MRDSVRTQATTLKWAAGALVALLLPVCAGLLAAGGNLPLGLRGASASDERPLLFLGDKDYPPITYVEQGAAKGVDVDLAKALAKPMGREIRVELMDWDLAQAKVLKGEADGLLSMSLSEERKTLYDFTDPAFTNEFGLFVRRGDMTIRGASDLPGKRVGVTPGGFPRRFLETHPGVTLVLIENYEDGFERLAAGAIDSVAADLWVAAYTIQAHRIRGVTVAGEPFATRQAGIAVKKGKLALVAEINRAIKILESDGTISQIHKRWQPQQMVFLSRERLLAIVLLVVGTFLVLLVCAMVVWIVILRKQIRVRRKSEASLRESEERFRALVEQAPEAIVVFDLKQGRIVDANSNAERLFGYQREELLASGPERFLAPQQPDGRPISESVREYSERALAGETLVFERAVRDAKGQDHVCEVRLVRLPAAGLKLVRASFIDITARKRAGEALREAEERYRRFVEMSAEGVWRVDFTPAVPVTLDEPQQVELILHNSRQAECNDALARAYGYKKAADMLEARLGFDDVLAGSQEEKIGLVSLFIRSEYRITDLEVQNRTRNGKRLWGLDNIVGIVGHGHLMCAWGTRRDITARKQAEEALAERTRQLEAVRVVNEEITHEMRWPVLLELIVERAMRLVGAAGGSVLLWDGASSVLIPSVWVGRPPGSRTSRVALGEGLSGTVAAQRKGMIVNDYRNSPLARPVMLEHTKITATIAEPLLYQDRLVGVINLDNGDTDRRFTEQDQEILRLFAAQAAIAIENARLYGATQRELADRARAEQHLERSREQLRALSSRLQSLREEERTRIAREIHDHLGQLLTALKMDLRTLDRRISSLGETELRAALQSKIAEATELIDETITSIQRIASELRPGILDRLGLAPAIEVEAQAFESRTGIHCQWSLPADLVAIPPDHATAVFRIFQEVLTNVARHAQATQVTVRLCSEGDSLLLQVMDDGVGIQERDMQDPKSLGLLGMQERAAILGGKITFSGRAGTGTTVTVRLPLEGKAGQGQ